MYTWRVLDFETGRVASDCFVLMDGGGEGLGSEMWKLRVSEFRAGLRGRLPSHPVTKRHASSDSGSAATWESQIRDRRSAVRFALGSWLAVARRSRRTHLVTAFLVRRDDEPVAAPLLLVV